MLKRTAQDIVDLSQICHEYHEEFGYQEYIRWVKEDLGLSGRMGRSVLNVFEQFGTTKFAVDNIQPSILYLLAAPSTPESAREEAVEKAEAGGNEGMGDQGTDHPGLLGYTACMMPKKMHTMVRVWLKTGLNICYSIVEDSLPKIGRAHV